MSDTNRPIDGPAPDIAPDAADSAGQPGAPSDSNRIASEQFIHGLLGFLHHDTQLAQERRIARVLERLERGEIVVRPSVLASISWRRFAPLAAAVLVLVGVIAILIPTEQSATATVQTSLAALRQGGERRYEVRAVLPGSDSDDAGREPIATIDFRDESHLLVRARTPHGERVTLGRDEQGKWVIHPDGVLDRFPPRQAWPRWLDAGESTIMLESVDTQLESVLKNYTLQRTESARLPGGDASRRFERITARHTRHPTPEPERIELWIDPDTRLVQRMELHWPERQWRPPPPPHAPAGPPRGAPRFRPGPGPGPDGGPPPPRPGDGGVDGPPPPRRPHGPPPGPPSGADDPLDGGPGSGRDLEGDGPRGPRPPRPRFLDGPPEFGVAGPGRPPPPPRIMIFERVEAPGFPEGWFGPEAHRGGSEE